MMVRDTPHISGFDHLLHYIEDITGITVPDTNYRSLVEEVQDRSKALKLNTLEYIKTLREDSSERERLLNAATINETYFFRESRHFTVLRNVVLPQFPRNRGPVLAWSATCATGEEGISLALILKDYFGEDTRACFTVYATDLNTAALSQMKEGAYSKNSFREDGREYHHLVEKNSTPAGNKRKISSGIIHGIRIARKNLYLDSLEDMPDSFHIVFLRNTLIYMKGRKKLSILDRIASRIREGGCLFLSSSEMPLVVHPDLEPVQEGDIYFFRKKKRAHRDTGSDTMKQTASAKTSIRHGERSNHAAAKTGTGRPPVPVSIPAVLDAAQRISESRGKDIIPDNRARVIAELLLYCVHFINVMKLGTARDILSILLQYFNNEITSHLLGFMAMLEGERTTAASFFRNALAQNSSFWPSRFYLANTVKDRDPAEALKEFTLCGETLSRNNASGNTRYGFLVEHFSEKYFLDLCDAWTRSLKKVSQRQQPGVETCR